MGHPFYTPVNLCRPLCWPDVRGVADLCERSLVLWMSRRDASLASTATRIIVHWLVLPVPLQYTYIAYAPICPPPSPAAVVVPKRAHEIHAAGSAECSRTCATVSNTTFGFNSIVRSIPSSLTLTPTSASARLRVAHRSPSSVVHSTCPRAAPAPAPAPPPAPAPASDPSPANAFAIAAASNARAGSARTTSKRVDMISSAVTRARRHAASAMRRICAANWRLSDSAEAGLPAPAPALVLVLVLVLGLEAGLSPPAYPQSRKTSAKDRATVSIKSPTVSSSRAGYSCRRWLDASARQRDDVAWGSIHSQRVSAQQRRARRREARGGEARGGHVPVACMCACSWQKSALVGAGSPTQNMASRRAACAAAQACSAHWMRTESCAWSRVASRRANGCPRRAAVSLAACARRAVAAAGGDGDGGGLLVRFSVAGTSSVAAAASWRISELRSWTATRTSAPDQLSVLVRKGSFGLVEEESEYEVVEEVEE